MYILKESMKDNLGKCYELSWQYVTRKHDYNLIHGYITQKQTNITIDHAWTEKGDEVYDPVMEKSFPKVVYYALFNVEIAKIYTSSEANKNGAKFGTYGPWHKIPSGKIKHPQYKGK